MIGSAILEEVWYTKGYLLNLSIMKRYSFIVECKEASGKVLPRGIRYIPRKHGQDSLCGLVLCADLASVEVCNVGIHSGPVDGSLGSVFHLLNNFMVTM